MKEEVLVTGWSLRDLSGWKLLNSFIYPDSNLLKSNYLSGSPACEVDESELFHLRVSASGVTLTLASGEEVRSGSLVALWRRVVRTAGMVRRILRWPQDFRSFPGVICPL